MTDTPDDTPEGAAADWEELVSSQAEETLLETEQALVVATRLFRSLLDDYRTGGDPSDAEFKALALRMTALQTALLKEKTKYDLEKRRVVGGKGAAIDFTQVRSEIGSALDRIRCAEASDGLSGQPVGPDDSGSAVPV